MFFSTAQDFCYNIDSIIYDRSTWIIFWVSYLILEKVVFIEWILKRKRFYVVASSKTQEVRLEGKQPIMMTISIANICFFTINSNPIFLDYIFCYISC